MNILLVYPNVMGVHKIPLGLGYLSSCLKEAGHKVSILDTTFGITEEDIIKSSKDVDLVGVSVMTLQLEQAKWISRILKEAYPVPILWGGNHVTMRPVECIDYDFVDIVCVGEGEDAVVELANRLDGREKITHVENLWVKENGKVYQNPVRPLIQNLDNLPWPDRDAFDKRHLRISDGSIVSGSRKCPFSCGYCTNESVKQLYKGKGRFVNHRSVENLLAELQMMRKKYGVSYFEFADETFTLRRKWVLEFCEKYKKILGFPFIFQTRCDAVDYEILKAIREAGCNELSFGVESGNEKFRNEILGKELSDETIFNAFKIAKSLGFTVRSFNMMGMPNETEKMIVDTIKINKKIKPDIHNVCIFYPFPGTRLGDLCEERGWIEKKDLNLDSYYYDTVLKMPQLDRITILTYQKFFPVYLKLPVSCFPLVTTIFKSLLKMAYYVQRKTGSKFLREFLNNIYWLASALTNIRLMRKLLSALPIRIPKLLRDKQVRSKIE